MKRIINALAIAAILISTSAQSALFRGEFSGQISVVHPQTSITGVSIGDAISGYFEVETDFAQIYWAFPDSVYYGEAQNQPFLNSAINVNGSLFSSSDFALNPQSLTNQVAVFDDDAGVFISGDSYYFLEQLSPYSNLDFGYYYLNLIFGGGDFLSSMAAGQEIPGPISGGGQLFHIAKAAVDSGTGLLVPSDRVILVDFEFDNFSMTEVYVVPIPAALSLYISALGLLGCISWKRKSLTSALELSGANSTKQATVG